MKRSGFLALLIGLITAPFVKAKTKKGAAFYDDRYYLDKGLKSEVTKGTKYFMSTQSGHTWGSGYVQEMSIFPIDNKNIHLHVIDSEKKELVIYTSEDGGLTYATKRYPYDRAEA